MGNPRFKEFSTKRREFLKAVGTGAASLAASLAVSQIAAGETKPAKQEDSRPNLLIIHTDQQSSWTLGAYGGTLISTPHIDRIGREGAILNNFFTNSAICTPSRGCFLTGRYPHCHGAIENNVPLNDDEVTFSEILRRQGYDTGYVGKWHLDGKSKQGWEVPGRPFGFTDYRYRWNRGHGKKVIKLAEGGFELAKAKWKKDMESELGDEKTYTTDWLATKTIEFVQKKRGGPFCFMVSIPDPHDPYVVREPYKSMYKPEDLPIPSNFDEESQLDWCKKAQGSIWRRRALYKEPLRGKEREQMLRQDKAQYCGEVKCIDDNVGRILKQLEKQGILDNTIIVYTTDHGEYMGEHGLMYKNQLYETAHRIPMLIRWPKKIRKGTVVDEIIDTVDFSQTILGLMAVNPSSREQGRDGSALLQGKKVNWANESFIHHSSSRRAGIFTPQYELAYVKDSKDHILFDRIKDPKQINNLFSDPKYKGVVDELTERIVRHNVEIKSPAAEWLKLLQT